MPARVMLLLLATAMFIAIWSGDERKPATKSSANPDARPPNAQGTREQRKVSVYET